MCRAVGDSDPRTKGGRAYTQLAVVQPRTLTLLSPALAASLNGSELTLPCLRWVPVDESSDLLRNLSE